MRSVEMAVVVSEEAEEEKKFAKQKLDIKPHRERMNRIDAHGHDVEYNFKDPEHPLQLVFVCAMWLTGFDAPTVSTLYLDKPMKDHTLMQTIARANRVTSWKINGVEKKNGEIVDYYNVFRNMKKALKDYAQARKGRTSRRSRKRLSCSSCSTTRSSKEWPSAARHGRRPRRAPERAATSSRTSAPSRTTPTPC